MVFICLFPWSIAINIIYISFWFSLYLFFTFGIRISSTKEKNYTAQSYQLPEFSVYNTNLKFWSRNFSSFFWSLFFPATWFRLCWLLNSIRGFPASLCGKVFWLLLPCTQISTRNHLRFSTHIKKLINYGMLSWFTVSSLRNNNTYTAIFKKSKATCNYVR